MMDKTIDIHAEEVKPQASEALAVREPTPERTEPVKPTVTAAQAKVEAIADLTAAAYARASQLQLTAEEIAALQKDFPDEAFKPGAAGKEKLLYIEHAFLRDRLNEVIHPGQWALIPRSRWGEDFSYEKQGYGDRWITVKGTRCYVEAMLMVRGCFVSEAVGEMEYYANNAGANYGDAVEGAKTAALRRCCKEFGIGLQPWKKDWCEGWWRRKNTKSTPATAAKPSQGSPAARPGAPAAAAKPATAPSPTAKAGEEVFLGVTVLSIKEVHSKPDAKKKWVAFFVRFSDGVQEMEAATFDANLAAFANELANTNESAILKTRPGNKPNTKEIVSLERSEQPPTEEDDQVPMEFDKNGQPITENTP